MIGQTIADRYQIEKRVGRGGMGTVYRANDLTTQQPVAIKFLHSEMVSAANLTRFRREFRVLARLQHANIVRAYDYGAHADAGGEKIPYLVLEWLNGRSLQQQLSDGPLPPDTLLPIIRQLTEALIYLHNQGIIHRDIKPGNIMLLPGATPRVKLMDFGLVRLNDLSVQLTQAGSTLGTVAYIAPEQAHGYAVDFRADLYALGVVMFEMATGRPPFVHDNIATLILQQITAPPPSPRQFNPDLDPALAQFILQLLAKEPAQRPATTEAVLTHLAYLADESSPRLATPVNRADIIPPIPLIGRETLQLTLGGWWAEAAAADGPGNNGRFALLSGVAGVGKTRLLTEISLQVRASNGRFLRQSCREQAALPYQPFIPTLQRLARRLSPAERADLSPELGRLLPAIISPPAGSGNEAESQLRLFTAIANLIETAAAGRPLCIAIEDIQWADASTLELLAYLAEQTAGTAVLLLATYRPEETTDQPALQSFLQDQARRDPTRQHEIPLLTRPQVEQFLQFALGWQQVPAWLTDSFHTATAGNPLFIEETLKALAAEGEVAKWHEDEQRQWTTTLSSPTTPLQLPQSVLALAQRRLTALSAADKTLLAAAAVIGPEFTFALWQRVTDADEETLIDALDRLLANRVIAELPLQAGEDRYRFAQESLRQASLQPLSQRRRRLLHRKTGEAILALYGADEAAQWPHLAHHFAAARDHDQALRFFLLAGQAATAVYAHAAAVNLYTQALELVTGPAPPTYDSQQQIELFTSRGRSLELSARYPEALDNYQQMLEIATDHGDQALQLAALIALTTIRSTPNPARDLAEALVLGEHALQLAREVGTPADETKALWCLQLACSNQGDNNAAITYGEAAIALAREHDLRELLAFALNDIFPPYRNAGKLNKAQTAVDEARQLWRELNNLYMLADCLGNSASLYLAQGDFQRCLRYTAEIRQISETSDNAWGRVYSANIAAFAYQFQGQTSQAIDAFRDSIRLSDAGGVTWVRGSARCALADLYGYLQAPERGMSLVAEALQLDESSSQTRPGMAWAAQAKLLVQQGDLAAARHSLEQCWELGGHAELAAAWATAHLARAEGEPLTAVAPLQERIAAFRQSGVLIYAANLLYELAQCYQQAGDLAAAVAAVNDAGVLLPAQEKMYTWQVRYLQGRLAADQDDNDSAADHFAAAAEIVAAISQGITDPDLRAAFAQQTAVQTLLNEA